MAVVTCHHVLPCRMGVLVLAEVELICFTMGGVELRSGFVLNTGLIK